MVDYQYSILWYTLFVHHFSLSTIVHARSRNHSCSGNTISIKHYECVSAFLHLFGAVSHYHPWPVWLYDIFLHNLINGRIFGGESLNIQRVFQFCLQILSKIFLILTRIQPGIFINVQRSSCKVSFIIVSFQSNLDFLDIFSKNLQISNFLKIRPVEAEVFHADRQTERHDEANSHISQSCGSA
jgi:hypothetical protein